MKDHAEIIGLWPSLSEFAADIGVPYGTAKKMKRRNSIAPAHWQTVVDAADRRGFSDVTLASLAELYSSDSPPVENAEVVKTVEAAE